MAKLKEDDLYAMDEDSDIEAERQRRRTMKAQKLKTEMAGVCITIEPLVEDDDEYEPMPEPSEPTKKGAKGAKGAKD